MQNIKCSYLCFMSVTHGVRDVYEVTNPLNGPNSLLHAIFSGFCMNLRFSEILNSWIRTNRKEVQWPDKYLYLSPILWSKTILIASWVREKGVNDPSYKMRTIFLMSLALSVPIFNKKSHRTQAVETFEVWPNFESFHRSCRMRFFVEN